MKSWIDALKEFNTGGPMWSIPRKGSSQHAFVMRIMNGMTNVPDKVQLIERKIKKNKRSMLVSI
jgi:hypothetical protein